jgi:hypothetical protein
MTEGRRVHPSVPPTEDGCEPPTETRRRPPPGAELEAQRIGPLLVERHRKRDGRLLILYRPVEDR